MKISCFQLLARERRAVTICIDHFDNYFSERMRIIDKIMKIILFLHERGQKVNLYNGRTRGLI